MVSCFLVRPLVTLVSSPARAAHAGAALQSRPCGWGAFVHVHEAAAHPVFGVPLSGQWACWARDGGDGSLCLVVIVCSRAPPAVFSCFWQHVAAAPTRPLPSACWIVGRSQLRTGYPQACWPASRWAHGMRLSRRGCDLEACCWWGIFPSRGGFFIPHQRGSGVVWGLAADGLRRQLAAGSLVRWWE